MSDEACFELVLRDDRREVPPVAWQGGTHDGSRLSQDERDTIQQLFEQSVSAAEISRLTGHGRNTIAAVVSNPENAAKLRESRAARLLIAEEFLLRDRDELIESLRAKGKLKLSDVNSALMITGIGIKDAGGSAPLRMEVSVDHQFHAAAELMSGAQVSRAAAVFAPVPQVVEVQVEEVKSDKG